MQQILKVADGRTALNIAVERAQKPSVLALLDAGADVNIATELGSTPLLSAVRNENIDLMRLLLKAHASLSIKDEDGWTVLHWAVSGKGNMEMVELLVDSGASLTAVTKNGNMPYDMAVTGGNVPIQKFLRAKGGVAHIAEGARTAQAEPDKARFTEEAESGFLVHLKGAAKGAVKDIAMQRQVATVAVAGCCSVQ